MIGRVGEKVILRGLILVQKTWYEKAIKWTDKTRVVWRYCFTDPQGERIVYSGSYSTKWMHLVKEGKPITLKATIKKHDHEYGLTRIMRPAIVDEESEGKLL